MTSESTEGTPPSDLADAARAVLAANEAFYAAFNTKNAAAMEECWARSFPVACTHPGWNAIEGREGVLDSWRAIMANPEQPKVFTGAAQAFVRGELAFVVCRELVSGTPLSATNVFVLEDGDWRLAHHHSSTVAFVPGGLV